MPHFDTRRTLLMNPEAARRTLLQNLPAIKDVTITDTGNPIHIDRKRRLTANRYAMNGTVNINGDELSISLDGLGSMHEKFASEILALLPEGATHDHGLNAALAKMEKSAKLFGFREISTILDDMQSGEEIQMITTGTLDDNLGIIVLTNLRAIIKDRKLMGSEMKEINPTSITSLSTGKKLTGETVKMTVSGSDLEITALPHGRGTELANLLRQAMGGSARPTASAAPVETTPDPVAQIEKLAELHAAGILNDDEFMQAKAKALGI